MTTRRSAREAAEAAEATEATETAADEPETRTEGETAPVGVITAGGWLIGDSGHWELPPGALTPPPEGSTDPQAAPDAPESETPAEETPA